MLVEAREVRGVGQVMKSLEDPGHWTTPKASITAETFVTPRKTIKYET